MIEIYFNNMFTLFLLWQFDFISVRGPWKMKKMRRRWMSWQRNLQIFKVTSLLHLSPFVSMKKLVVFLKKIRCLICVLYSYNEMQDMLLYSLNSLNLPKKKTSFLLFFFFLIKKYLKESYLLIWNNGSFFF